MNTINELFFRVVEAIVNKDKGAEYLAGQHLENFLDHEDVILNDYASTALEVLSRIRERFH